MTVYLAALSASILATDWLANRFDRNETNSTIKLPRKELKWILFAQAMNLILLFIRFQILTDMAHTSILLKLPFFALALIFVFPVFLLVIFLKWRYSLKDLVFGLKSVLLGLPVILILGAAAVLFASGKFSLRKFTGRWAWCN